MASVMSSIKAHKLENSHQLVKPDQMLLSSEDQMLVKTQVEGSMTTEQAGIPNGKQAPLETTDIQITRKHDFESTQNSIAFPNNLNMSKTEVKDIIMADEVDAGNRIRRTPSSGPGDVQVISKEEFIHPNEDHISKPRKENRRMSKRFQEATVQSVPSQRGSRTRRNQVSSAQDDPQKLQQLKQELAGVRRELKASQGQLQETYEELRKTRRKLAASQEELTICKDEMFGSQPTTQIPDSRVAKEFENLCQQIVNWVEAEVVVFEKAHPEEGQEHVFSMGEDKEAAQFMAQHPTGGEHLAVYMIHRWLQDNLFGRKLSCIGLPAETIQLLESVEQSMAHLDPPRGNSNDL